MDHQKQFLSISPIFLQNSKGFLMMKAAYLQKHGSPLLTLEHSHQLDRITESENLSDVLSFMQEMKRAKCSNDNEKGREKKIKPILPRHSLPGVFHLLPCYI